MILIISTFTNFFSKFLGKNETIVLIGNLHIFYGVKSFNKITIYFCVEFLIKFLDMFFR